MKIAIITGASSGLGEKFALEIDKSRSDIEEIWLIARREEKLKALAQKLAKNTKVLSLDITNAADLEKYKSNPQSLRSVGGLRLFFEKQFRTAWAKLCT